MTTPTATPGPTITGEGVFLALQDVSRLTQFIYVGNRVQVSVSVTQQGDEGTLCGNPSVQDASRNVLATLSAINITPGVEASYEYSFFAAATQEYSVVFDNGECNVRMTPAAATVTWAIYEG